MPMKQSFQTWYTLLIRLAGSLQSPFLLIVRLYWGWQFFIAGKGKLMNLDNTAKFFESIDIPAPKLNAFMAGSTECFGGLLLLLGLCSRLVSIPLIFTMCVAYLTAHNEELKSIFSKPDDFLSAGPFQFLMAAVIVLIFGPGKFSLDYLLQRTLWKPARDSAGFPIASK